MSRGLEGKASQDTKIRRGLPLRPCYGNLGSRPLTPVTDATRDVCPCPPLAPPAPSVPVAVVLPSFGRCPLTPLLSTHTSTFFLSLSSTQGPPPTGSFPRGPDTTLCSVVGSPEFRGSPWTTA